MAIYKGNNELTLNNVSTVKHGGVTVYLHKYIIDAPFNSPNAGWIDLNEISNLTRGHHYMYIEPSYPIKKGKIVTWDLTHKLYESDYITRRGNPDPWNIMLTNSDHLIGIMCSDDYWGKSKQDDKFKIWFD